MLERRTLKFILVALCAALLCLVVAISASKSQQECLGIPLIEETELHSYTQTDTLDMQGLLFNGFKAAVDVQTKTVYISQSKSKLSHYALLEGALQHRDPTYSLCLLHDAALDDLQAVVHNNQTLTLIIKKGNSYQRANIGFSTLPVLRIDGNETGLTDDEGRSIFAGDFTLWAGLDPLLEQYSTRSGSLEFHIRGNTSATTGKPPWKLSVKSNNGSPKDATFLNLGTDDDWILNSLTFDDTRLREKFFSDLWNKNASTTPWNYPMTSGTYTEVVMNGQFLGLFLLQRRIDPKYLNLQKNDVLLKSTTYGVSSVQAAYEILSNDVDSGAIYATMQSVFDGTDCSAYHVNNMIDTNLLLQFASAHDNFGLKNIYHVLQKNGNTYVHYLIPWDTDMSFGVHIRPEYGFCYDYDVSISMLAQRMETSGLKKFRPEYDRLAALRWHELRCSLLQENILMNEIDVLNNQLNESGALLRDKALWGDRYKGEDTSEKLKTFISERLAFLDAHYAS